MIYESYVALSDAPSVPIESMYTVPVKVPVATLEDGLDDMDAAVELGMIVDGILKIVVFRWYGASRCALSRNT